MSKICQITGKKAMVGNNVSHSKRRTKRTFDANLFTKKFYYVETRLLDPAQDFRSWPPASSNKVGLDQALEERSSKGLPQLERY